MKRASLALLLVLLTCLAPRLRRPWPGTDPVDFHVYWSAASLVHHGAANQLYVGADRGGDPQKAVAGPGTPIHREATAQGLSFVGLYVYPPLLADLMLPYTWVPLHTATHLWLASNLLFLLLTAWCTLHLLDIPFRRGASLVLLVSVFGFTPVLQTLHDGQITIFLLLLWTAATCCFKKGWFALAGAVFACAAAIKLTPLLVVLPFAIWRKWRVLGAFVLTLIALLLLCLAINSPQTSWIYFTRVMPAMSGSIPYISNFSLSAATARWLTLLHAGAVGGYPAVLPTVAVRVGRLLPLLILASVGVLLLRSRRANASEQVFTLGLLSLLAPVLSPVSWFHAYAMAYIAFALLWQRFLERESPRWTPLLALTLVSLLFGTALSENLLATLDGSLRFAALATWLQLGELLLTVALILHELWAMGGARVSSPPSTVGAPQRS